MRNLKILGLSLLALVGVMAVSAAAAQAKWLLLRNGAPVQSLTLVAEAEEGELLVEALGLAINCEGGEGEVEVESVGASLAVNAEPVFEGCTDLNFGEACTVKSPGEPVGTIAASGTGEGSMVGANVYITAESEAEEPFTEVLYEGAECPLIEIDGRVSGSVQFEILNPLANTLLKVVHISEEELFFGENPAELHMFGPEEETLPLLGSLTEVSGATFGVHLEELPGCPVLC